MWCTHDAGDGKFLGSACCHPAFFGKEIEFSQAAESPVCILAAEGDPMEDAKAVLEAKPFAEQCFFRRFDDQVHGFMAARGDYSDPTVAAAVGQGIQCLVDFFNKCIPAE